MKAMFKGANFNTDGNGNTTGIPVSFENYPGDGNSLSATAVIVESDLDEGVTFDELNRKQIEAIGRKIIAGWFDGKEEAGATA